MAEPGTARQSAGRVSAELVREALRDAERLAGLLELNNPRKVGGKIVARCPFHQPDKHPSFALLPTRAGGWAGKCLKCGADGDAMSLVARKLGRDTSGRAFVDLLDDLGRRLGLSAGTATASPRATVAPTPAPPPPDLSPRRDTMHRVWEVLQRLAPLRGEVRDYLLGRGFRPDELPDDWCALPPPGEQAALVRAIVAGIGKEAWRDSGLAAYGDRPAFAFPENRLVLPWWHGSSTANATVGLLQRRRIGGDGSIKSKYVAPKKLPPAAPYGAVDVFESDPQLLVFVEGALDVHAVMALARDHGMDWCAVGFMGATTWQDEWLELGRGRDCVIGFDADTAGENPETLARLHAGLLEAGARSVTREIPAGAKDWLELLGRVRGGR